MKTIFKTLPKRFKTKKTGIYYKQIEKTVIDDQGNISTTILKDDKVYCIQYKDIDEKWKFKTIGKYSDGIREAYCHRKRLEIMNQTLLGEQPDLIKKKVKKNTITLHEIFEKYKDEKKSQSKDIIKTEQKYRSNIYKVFGNKDINTITSDDIFKFRTKLVNKKLAPSTINNNITFIGTLFNFAIEEKLYDKANPIKAKKLKSAKVNNTRDRYLTTTEINQLFDAVKDDAILTLFIHLSLTTGGRLETILNIKKKDIDLDNKNIKLHDLKNNSIYTNFLSQKLVDILKINYNDLEPNSYIVGYDLEKYPTRTLQRHLKKILDDLFNQGLDLKDAKNRVVIHTLRHTFASHLAINGTPIFTIQKLMNHNDIKMTMRYAKLAPDSGKNAIEELYK